MGTHAVGVGDEVRGQSVDGPAGGERLRDSRRELFDGAAADAPRIGKFGEELRGRDVGRRRWRYLLLRLGSADVCVLPVD
ncbi:hypothetical protein ACFPIJ_55845 [Dactylosporangium cerinum]|uniref:Uncharacterized protein n=1 Tax=Dactylosporangium cerinum TaxID=1434730 RepID=A0ABV9WJ92_9ACTN